MQLRHPITSTRHPGARRTGRLATLTHKHAVGKHATVAAQPPASASTAADPVPLGYDIDARRVRDAGGPIDEATYSCACGYVFAASVTTSVCCPHCHATQAW